MKKELGPQLQYHSIEHTMDVLNSAITIAELEGISKYELELVKTGAMYHDAGIMETYIGHEEASVEIVNKTLPRFGYTKEEIELISSMILTTKLPQNTSSFLEQIICDADLDYLGRDNFFMTSHKLLYEWKALDIRSLNLTQWYELQIEFLSTHKFLTKSSIAMRQKKKLQNLQEIRELMRS
ncbi:MAG: HD domain-containing protein [Bacteroidetes bacterium]|nr:HD domain-containing protein [Bacteroidota bacterium]